MKKLLVAVAALVVVGCANTAQFEGESVEDYYARATESQNAKWAAVNAMVTQAQADGVEIINLDEATLGYLKALCNAAILGPTVIEAPVALDSIDWNLVPNFARNACQVAMKIATPVEEQGA